MKKLISLIATLLLTFLGHSQVVMNLQLPAAGIILKDQLWNLSLVNSGSEEVYIQLEMQLSDVSSNQRVLTAVTREFFLPKGVKQIRQADLLPITYNVVNPSYPVDANPNGFLPIGVFNVCFTVIRFINDGSERVSDECETIEVEPVSPPLLVLPEDKDKVEAARPLFTWIPPAPLNLFNRLSYDLVLVEIQPTQSATDAVTQNIPLFVMPDIMFTSLQYPYTAPELDTSRIYAWRVNAKNNGLPIANSDTWTFTVLKPAVDNKSGLYQDNYTKLNRQQDGSMTIGMGSIRYEYNNELNDTIVNVTIYDVSTAKRREIQFDGEIQSVKFGVNLKEIDFEDNPAMIDRHIYLFELVNAKQERWYLKFQYRKP